MKLIIIAIFSLGAIISGYSQDLKPTDSLSWKFSFDANLYFIPDNFITLPVLRADKNKLHLEARYNYEDLHTTSVWAGYNFYGGKKIEYIITPMVGAAIGNTRGFITGVEFSFTRNNWELYNESEFLVDAAGKDYNYFYTWVDLTYSIKDWWWVGLSAQRTKLYHTKLEIQRGIILGASWKQLEFTGYLYNAGFDTPLGLLTLTANF